MKIQANGLDRFVSGPDPNVVAVLVYGPDAGLVRERCNRLSRAVAEDPNDPFGAADFPASALKDEPSRLSDETSTFSLTGGRRLVRLRGAGDGEASALQAAIDLNNPGALIVVDGGDLPPRSALRKLFETEKNAAAVACYPDDVRSLQSLVVEITAAHGIDVAREAMSYLVENLGSDRQVSRNEIEKLALFVGDNGHVELEDAVACVGDSAAVTIDDVVFATGEGDTAGLVRALNRALADGAEPIAILRAAQRHFQRLGLCAARVESGDSVEQAVSALRPPVFFKRSGSFRAQVGKWRSGTVGGALEALTEAEIRCKSTGVPGPATCERALLQLATRASRQGRQ